MPATANPRVVYAKPAPVGTPVIGEHIIYNPEPTIDLENVALNGGFLTKTLILSPEPYVRDRMRPADMPTYSTTFVVGTPIVSFGLVQVLRSEKEGVKVGDYMLGMTPWESYTVQPYMESRVKFKAEDWPPFTTDMDSLALQPVPNPGGAFPLSNFINVLGVPGLTAFYGMEAVATDLKPGEVMYVSAGASAVGSLVIQLAKAKGLTVIASASSDDKAKYMSSLGADHVFNYNKTSYNEVLKAHGPINVYWDNTGGDALAAALENAALSAQFLMCGHAVDYNTAKEDRYPLKAAINIFTRRIRMKGLLVSDAPPELIGRFYTEVPGLIAQGKIVSKEHIVHGIENAAEAFIESIRGDGKVIGKWAVLLAES